MRIQGREWHARLADPQIEAEREGRDQEAERGRQKAEPRRGGLWRGARVLVRVLVGGSEEAAFDLGARGRGVLGGEAVRGALALHFGELVAIDREVAVQPLGGTEPRAQQRDQQHTHGARGQQREEEFEHDGLAVIPRPKAEGPFAMLQGSLASLRMTPFLPSGSASSLARSASLSGAGPSAALRRREANHRSITPSSSTAGAPSQRTKVRVLKGGFSRT